MPTTDLPPCQIMQSELYPTGWVNEDVWFEETVCIKHLVPCGDLRLHQLVLPQGVPGLRRRRVRG